jgi:hypothetical protein
MERPILVWLWAISLMGTPAGAAGQAPAADP